MAVGPARRVDEGRGAGRAWVQALLRAQCQAPLSSPWWRPGHVPPLRPSCFPGHTAGGSDLPPWGPPEPEARALSRAKPISTVTVRNTEEKVHGGGGQRGREGQGAHGERGRSTRTAAGGGRGRERTLRAEGPSAQSHALSARPAGARDREGPAPTPRPGERVHSPSHQPRLPVPTAPRTSGQRSPCPVPWPLPLPA